MSTAPGTPAPSAASPPAPTPAPAARSRAVGAGRGLALILGAKVWFMLGASIIGFILPRLFRSKEVFGDYSLVVSVVSTLNNVMVTATIQAVARFAAAGPAHVEGAKRAALRLQLVAGGTIALAYALLAPTIAGFYHDPALTGALRLSTGIVIAYAFYAVFVGAANGAREFQKQAALDATFTTLRAALVCAGAVLYASVVAAVGGFVLAAGIILVLSVVVVGVRPVEQRVDTRAMARFILPVAAYLLITNMLMFVDGWVLKRLVAEAGEAAGALDPARAASAAVGVYAGAQNIARIPYQAILAVTFVIFPLVSATSFAADPERMRGYVERSLRLSLLAVAALAAAVAARPDALLGLLPAEYAPAAPALSVLAYGYVAFSLLSIAGTILNAAGRTSVTTLLGAITLALDVALTFGAVRWAIATGHDPLRAAACATAGAMAVGLALALAYLQRSFGASLRLASLRNAAIAAAVAMGVGRVLPLGGRVGALAACAASGLAYLATLFIVRELTPRELRALAGRSG